MIKKIISFLLISLISTSILAEDKVDQTIKPALEKMMSENNIPGLATTVYIHGKAYSYYLGYADPEKKLPVTKKTIFELGSITKLFTGLLLAQTVDRNQVTLDKSITKYLLYLGNNYKSITLENLATFTAGLPLNPPENIKTKKELIKYFKELKLNDKPGSERTYSNPSIDLIGEALEVITHQNFNQLYRSRILSLLKMEPIAITIPAKYKNNLATGFTRNDEKAEPVNVNLMPSAYGMKASAEDMQKFLYAAIGLKGTPLKILYPMRMTQSSYLIMQNEEQGMIWKIHPLTEEGKKFLLVAPENLLSTEQVLTVLSQPIFNPNMLIDKTGTTNGFRTYIAVIPKQESGIVIMVNKNVPDNVIVSTARQLLLQLADSSQN